MNWAANWQQMPSEKESAGNLGAGICLHRSIFRYWEVFFLLLFMNRTGGVRKKKDLVGGGLLSLETRTCQLDKQEISSSRVILCKKKASFAQNVWPCSLSGMGVKTSLWNAKYLSGCWSKCFLLSSHSRTRRCRGFCLIKAVPNRNRTAGLCM